MRALSGEWVGSVYNRRLRQSILIITGALLIAGCASAPPSPPSLILPPLEAGASYHRGAPLTTSAAPASASSIRPDQALAIKIQWIALEHLPARLPPLLGRARLIASLSGADPLLPAGELTRAAKLVPPNQWKSFQTSLEVGDFGRQAILSSATAVLPPDVTANFHLKTAESAPGTYLEVAAYRSPATKPSSTQSSLESLHYSLLVEQSSQRERVMLDADPVHLPSTFGMIVPIQLGTIGPNSPSAALAVINIRAGDRSPEHARLLAKCQRELAGVRLASTQLSPEMRNNRQWQALLASTISSKNRAALVYLCTQSGASLCGDVALAADDRVMGELRDRIHQRTQALAAPPDREQLGWQLDASAMEVLAREQSSEKLSKELDGVLSAYAGQAGRDPGSVDEIIRSLASRDELQARIIAENFNDLEDISPAARVRAFDWLAAHGKAPPGYDPLAPLKQRRAALDKALSAAAISAASASNSTTSASAKTGGAP